MTPRWQCWGAFDLCENWEGQMTCIGTCLRFLHSFFPSSSGRRNKTRREMTILTRATAKCCASQTSQHQQHENFDEQAMDISLLLSSLLLLLLPRLAPWPSRPPFRLTTASASINWRRPKEWSIITTTGKDFAKSITFTPLEKSSSHKLREEVQMVNSSPGLVLKSALHPSSQAGVRLCCDSV